jgi:hypothetical protein
MWDGREFGLPHDLHDPLEGGGSGPAPSSTLPTYMPGRVRTASRNVTALNMSARYRLLTAEV